MSQFRIRSDRPDLSSMFLSTDKEQLAQLLDELARLDGKLDKLAADATGHVGFEYKNRGLDLFVRQEDAEISGGPSGDAGDLWFEISFASDAAASKAHAPPWEVTSSIIVFCELQWKGIPVGYSCTHRLFELTEIASTPEQSLLILERHIDSVGTRISVTDRQTFLGISHEELPGD
jgi:hypothetical protein